MTEKTFSINEALRFARHDFLNQLQLIKMNIDLARLEDAKAAIDHYSTEAKAFYELSKMDLPRTTEWLQTANWRFPGFQVSISNNIESDCNLLLDEQVQDVLEQTTKLLHEQLNPYTEQLLHIHIVCNPTTFKLTFDANGEWEPIQQELSKESQVSLTHECKTTKNWRFHIEESKEG
ncbi:Spo0B domain-containing protein [Paenisporosarcina sp. FSL H8-0542]|uniref:Spo0B domain-containing protein n=1 Tax=Paenisporosarcina sp. FSL H8-0542 TaxID=2921401 RepID=UPI003159B169